MFARVTGIRKLFGRRQGISRCWMLSTPYVFISKPENVEVTLEISKRKIYSGTGNHKIIKCSDCVTNHIHKVLSEVNVSDSCCGYSTFLSSPLRLAFLLFFTVGSHSSLIHALRIWIQFYLYEWHKWHYITFYGNLRRVTWTWDWSTARLNAQLAWCLTVNFTLTKLNLKEMVLTFRFDKSFRSRFWTVQSTLIRALTTRIFIHGLAPAC